MIEIWTKVELFVILATIHVGMQSIYNNHDSCHLRSEAGDVAGDDDRGVTPETW